MRKLRERIGWLAKGVVEYERPEAQVQPLEVEETVAAGRQMRGELRITSRNGVSLKGLAYSTDSRVVLQKGQFIGREAVIGYQIDGKHLAADTVISGAFHLVFNGGECSVPYQFSAAIFHAGEAVEEPQTATEFAELVKTEYEKGRRLFDSPDFLLLPFMQKPAVRSLYDGLKTRGSKQNALEEFLVGLGMKERIKLSVVDTAKTYQMPEQGFSDRVRIEKSTWGYVRIQVKADAAFIRLEKDVLTDEDFIDGQCYFSYHVDPAGLHDGLNYGAVELETPWQSFRIALTVTSASHRKEGYRKALEYQRHLAKYTDLFLDCMAGRYEKALQLNNIQTELGRLRSSYQTSDLLELLHALTYLMQDKEEPALLLIEDASARVIDKRNEDPDAYCLYLYLKAEMDRSDGQRASLEAALERYDEEGNRRIINLMLLLQVSTMLKENPVLRLDKIKSYFNRGLNSPYLYLAACMTYKEDKGLIKELGSFELQALLFGAKRELFDEETASWIAGFSASEKEFRVRYYRLLKILYEQYPNEELLSALCCILIKGDRRDKKYFTWYELGVSSDVRLTKLYDYYLYTLPKDYFGELPKVILLYFSFEHSLDYATQAALYANIIRFYKDDSQMYQAYRHRIEDFALEQLFLGHADENLAVIYRHIIYEEMIDEKIAQAFPAILFTEKICCTLPNMTHIVVCYEELCDPVTVPVHRGAAYVPVFSENCQVLTQDGYGNRYSGEKLDRTPLMQEPKMVDACFRAFPEHFMLSMRSCRQALDEQTLTEETVRLFEDAIAGEGLHELFKKQLLRAVLIWFSKNGTDGKCDPFLLGLDKDLLDEDMRRQYLELLIQKGYYPEAYEIIWEYGYEKVKVSRLFKLCSRMILQKVYEEDRFLLQLSYYVFMEEKFDSVILEYLCEYFNGSSEEMYQILKTAANSQVETYDMEERLLAQLMFVESTEHLDEVFADYVKRQTADPMILDAYFTLKCHAYFLGQLDMDAEVFYYIEKKAAAVTLDCNMILIHMLAVTKYYASLDILTDEQKNLAVRLLNILEKRGMVFRHLKELADKLGMECAYCDYTVIECRAQKHARLRIRTRLTPGMGQWLEEDMRHMYEGVFVKTLVLFENERLDYCIVEISGIDITALEDGTIEGGRDADGPPKNRLAVINRMLDEEKTGNEPKLKEQMVEYAVRDAAVDKIFEIL